MSTSVMCFCRLLLQISAFVCFISPSNSQSTTNTKCQYVAFNWDDLRYSENDTQTLLRKYEDADGGEAYLPPFPKLFDHYNESFAKVPYPTQQCLHVNNTDAGFASYMFWCVLGKPTLKTWQDGECAGDVVTESFSSLNLDDTTLDITYECDGSSEPCKYISIEESYYKHNAVDACNEEDIISTYTGKYAVDVCLSNEDETASFKYICDTRTLSYTRVQYSDPDCTDIDDEKQADGLEYCADQYTFIITVFDEGLNLTHSYDDTTYTIESARSTFVACTSIDEFELSYQDYCVSSQVAVLDDDGFADNTAVPQFGPFGMEPVSKKSLSSLSILDRCDPCNMADILNDGNCQNESMPVAWDESILLIDEQQTQAITQCDGGVKRFVKEVEALSDVDVHGIVFTATSNIASYDGTDNNNISIPTRIMNPTVMAKYEDILDASLSCNYRDGYPTEICISVTCTPVAKHCDNIMFAGTYMIDSTTRDKYNSNPIWEKSAIGEIEEQYIWLDVEVVSDGSLAGVTPYVELRWVVSSEIGNPGNGVYCTINDVNTESPNEVSIASNFDVYNCEWKAIESGDIATANNTSNQTSINVATAPFKCFDNTNTVPITLVCVETYQTVDISTFIGTYYEIASGSAIYIHDTSGDILKRGNKFDCDYEDDADYFGYYTLPMDDDTITMPQCQYLNTSWVLYRMQYDDINYYKIMAYCDIKASDTSSVVSCNEWFVYNNSAQAYFRDNSFDVDTNECEQAVDLPDYDEYEDILCFELMSNETETEMIYSHVQYLWGQYTKLNQTFLLNQRPIYQNTRLQNTPFDTYLTFYDPKDAWVFLTKSNFAFSSDGIAAKPILRDFDGFANFFQADNDKVIVAFCDNNNEEEDLFPQNCLNGWTINYEFYNLGNISLVESNENCTGFPAHLSNATFSKHDDIQDLCASFYQREEECIIPGEKYNEFNAKPDDCDTSPYFETDDWCSSNDSAECALLDGNGIYTINADKTISNRSYWIHEEETVFFYVYYHKYLRFWVWGTDNGESRTKLDSFAEFEWLEINAFCLRWDVSVEACTEFFYRNGENVQENASSIVDDCTNVRDDSIFLGQEISGWVIVGCFGVGLCVFCIGFYKEYMEKRNKKKGARMSRLHASGAGVVDEPHVAMVSQLDVSGPATITEEKTGDMDEDDGEDAGGVETLSPVKLQPVKVPSASTDI